MSASANDYRADVNGGAADADATDALARPAAEATAGRFLIFFFAGTAGMV